MLFRSVLVRAHPSLELRTLVLFLSARIARPLASRRVDAVRAAGFRQVTLLASLGEDARSVGVLSVPGRARGEASLTKSTWRRRSGVVEERGEEMGDAVGVGEVDGAFKGDPAKDVSSPSRSACSKTLTMFPGTFRSLPGPSRAPPSRCPSQESWCACPCPLPRL